MITVQKMYIFLKSTTQVFQIRVFHQMKITFLKFQLRTFVICSCFHWMVRITSNCPVIIVVSLVRLNSRKPSSGEIFWELHLLLFIYVCLLSRMVVFFFFWLLGNNISPHLSNHSKTFPHEVNWSRDITSVDVYAKKRYFHHPFAIWLHVD